MFMSAKEEISWPRANKSLGDRQPSLRAWCDGVVLFSYFVSLLVANDSKDRASNDASRALFCCYSRTVGGE